ncbi:XVIPCD domain-containing protein [Luteibacter aegosomatissinici]|uniref:XVIPCD domain-containing protein n=1 Tax=Luteibacter aegosomatissinici TaxID=2911539 RepID=UPI001FF8F1FC|nr:XVIPCD domain-containing protein [Luteibacter aegosomatissinici]UPG95801.1 DUF2974 domain-containing protein [Luteibacter aegosomatissinici]
MNERTNEYAHLASASYDERLQVGKEVIAGGKKFEVIDSAKSLFTGFSATTFRERESNNVVIAFRGTDDPLDGAVDGIMVSHRIDLQAIESERYTEATLKKALPRGSHVDAHDAITVTGHSLGGGLAQLNAEKFGLRGETFNAYGIVGLRGHDQSGGDQMINHVRATDLVSASSEHFGQVRIYATSSDIAALKAAGYGTAGHHGLGDIYRAGDVSAHYMENFDDKPGNPTVVNAVTAHRYEDNKALVDAFRHDVLTRRTTLTSDLDQPTLIGVRAMRGPAEAVVTTIAGQTLYTAAQAEQGVRMANHAGHDVINAARGVANQVSERFSDPHIVHGLGTATYGASLPTPHANDADLRHFDHPGHALYEQAHKGVSAVDAKLGRSPDGNSEKLAASITIAAARDGLQRIDHVILNGDGSKAFGVQGELNSPFKQIVQVDTAQAIKTPLEQSSQQWHGAVAAHQQEVAQQAARNQDQAQTQVQTQAAIRPHGP